MTTIVILDLAHHGTTMLAGCLEILGVSMVGASYDPERWEDKLIPKAIQDEHAFATVINARNHAMKMAGRDWGFKYPGAWLWADMMEKYLIDPVYFAIYKDPRTYLYESVLVPLSLPKYRDRGPSSPTDQVEYAMQKCSRTV